MTAGDARPAVSRCKSHTRCCNKTQPHQYRHWPPCQQLASDGGFVSINGIWCQWKHVLWITTMTYWLWDKTQTKKSLASLKRFTATVVNLLLLGTRVLASANVHKLSLEDAPGILTVLRRNMISPVSPTRPPPSWTLVVCHNNNINHFTTFKVDGISNFFPLQL